MKILATGAVGMLGSALVPALEARGHDVLVTDIMPDAPVQLDVRDAEAVMEWVGSYSPDFVAHLAAETSLELCEIDPDNSWLTNALGTRYVALACRLQGIPMAYISSAGIFDGTKEGAYSEFDAPNPINVYGASKYAGEQFVRQYVPESYIVRAGWMMGGGSGRDHKFVNHIIRQLLQGANEIHAVVDKFGTPTYAVDFAHCFERLIRSNRFGTYHMVSPGSCSRFDVALAIVEMLGYDDWVTVRAASSSHFSKEFFAPRPRSEVMRNYMLELEGMNTMRPWREALADYLKESSWPVAL